MEQTRVLETLSRFRQSKGAEYQIQRTGVFGSAARNQLTFTSSDAGMEKYNACIHHVPVLSATLEQMQRDLGEGFIRS